MNRIILISLLTILNLSAQIPSGDFETWDSFGTYMQPNGWTSTNEYATGPFYAITRDTSHFPSSVGTYSIRLENNLSLSFPSAGGAAKTGDTLIGGQSPFPITGHPNSLTGYYKFNPVAGDTMTIRVKLFYTDSGEVASATFHTTVAAPTWTSFTIPIPAYAAADSAEVLLAAFNIDTNTTSPYPQGNSVLYVDNLNFDNLITGINDISSTGITIYPNPATHELFVNTGDISDYLQLEVIDQLGKIVVSCTAQNKQKVDISFLPSGIYHVGLRTDQQLRSWKKLIVLD